MNLNRVQRLTPAINCWVTLAAERTAGGNIRLVIVVDNNDKGTQVLIRWSNSRDPEWQPIHALRSGFYPGLDVQDKPLSNTRRTFGTGTVEAERLIAGRDMVLVQLHKTGESRWFPFENLVGLRNPQTRYITAEKQDPDAGERFRLKALAYALDSWNKVTGALDRLDVDPLPHQIDLVHRIMTADQTNWLIADDVGLGKTIEVGLLLAALKRRRQARRVLVVCPAGVVRQWQDEMSEKFNEDFRIYGIDFSINQPAHWATYDKVIVSIDRAKSENHLNKFADSGDWDIIVFDEAHHLSKVDHQAATQRFQLAQRLRALTDAFIFLTGTPHQGNNPQFVNLLTLLRPDLRDEFPTIFSNPSLVAEIILRNRKSLVTNISGDFIFRGLDTHKIEVPLTDSARDFDQELQRYLLEGYRAADVGGVHGRAIGFVMTTYRKLASSSVPAIQRSLERRRARIAGDLETTLPDDIIDVATEAIGDQGSAYDDGVDGQDNLAEIADAVAEVTSANAMFFAGERQQLDRLLSLAQTVHLNDRKLTQLLQDIVKPVHDQDDKLLIYTEYRATQEYLVDALQRAYPDAGVAQINGSMSLQEKRRNIERFNTDAMFIVSTEAGGEGINLHHACHTMVNYDLPWNPARLVQRSGRLYRYRQRERVVVFNLVSDDGFDNTALGKTLDRVGAIARDMAAVGEDFQNQSAMETEIIGELLERMDIATVLATRKNRSIHRTERDIEDAIVRAAAARRQQEQLFSTIDGYDPSRLTALHTFGAEDVLLFLEGILPYRGIEIRNRQYNGRVFEIRLPDIMRGQYSDFQPGSSNVRITADRELARSLPNVSMMDFRSNFFLDLIEFAQSPVFKGEYANIHGPQSGTLGLFKLRWQNDQGVPTEEDLLPVFRPREIDETTRNPGFFGSLLGTPTMVSDALYPADQRARTRLVEQLRQSAEEELARRCTTLRHPNDVILLASADLTSLGDDSIATD